MKVKLLELQISIFSESLKIYCRYLFNWLKNKTRFKEIKVRLYYAKIKENNNTFSFELLHLVNVIHLAAVFVRIRFSRVMWITSVKVTWHACWGSLAFVFGGRDRHSLQLRRPSPQTFICFGAVGFIAWCLRRPFLKECRRIQGIFVLATHLSFGSYPTPTIKKA